MPFKLNNPAVINPDEIFEQELSVLLNRYNRDIIAETPDYVLAKYLVNYPALKGEACGGKTTSLG